MASTLAAIATIIRYLCAHFAMHFVYIVEFFCPPVYFEHPISQAFCDLASAKAVSPITRTVAKAIASVLRIMLSPGLKPRSARPIKAFWHATKAYSIKTVSPTIFNAQRQGSVNNEVAGIASRITLATAPKSVFGT